MGTGRDVRSILWVAWYYRRELMPRPATGLTPAVQKSSVRAPKSWNLKKVWDFSCPSPTPTIHVTILLPALWKALSKVMLVVPAPCPGSSSGCLNVQRSSLHPTQTTFFVNVLSPLLQLSLPQSSNWTCSAAVLPSSHLTPAALRALYLPLLLPKSGVEIQSGEGGESRKTCCS